eukprot:TRINITY_DN11682_c0_g1_i5.p2 TRINITY_DN11682_c0_g1~~TRINITY_DN11682_c0_g1_i5.p2  ORF type:complete len:128 (+),score=27.36 TRINITY_DN11682_c0_g1_i5:146-529(+)
MSRKARNAYFKFLSNVKYKPLYASSLQLRIEQQHKENALNRDPSDDLKPRIYNDIKGTKEWKKIQLKNFKVESKMNRASNEARKIHFNGNFKGSMLPLALNQYRKHCTLNVNCHALKIQDTAVYFVY